eukprot:TRINITY_DN14521_c0_g1_i2.p1 TRINITY_DN14521_c0_g1~~TRINITY_DN14521_c0_g1_i2.p1  ORF type:complete len:432 (-),score=102.67 TRINITY_DN14521_c0_g1_i2:224-1519(-)
MADKIIGATLLSGSGEVSASEAFAGKKAIGLYFSAHWCPPCRGFTPKLAEWYTKDLKEKGLEIVFVSSDKDEAAFADYFKEMPWLALPYSDRDLKNALSKKFKVQGIPTFIILDATTGDVITSDGREAVSKDPTGEKLPWIPPTFQEALGAEFLKGDEVVGKAAIEGKTLGLYFSAHWCPPCRGFTPQLAAWYKKIKPELGDKFEVIFCSGDRDEESMKSYYKEQVEAGGDWLCLPFASKDNLDSLFDVSGIPAFFIVSPEGKVINKSGRDLVPDSTPADFPWTPKPIGNLESPEEINESTCMLLMLEACDGATQKRILDAVEPIAKKCLERDEPIYFYAATSSGNVSAQVRGMCGIESASTLSKKDTSADVGGPKLVRTVSNDTPTIVLMDIPDNGGYYVGKMARELDGSGVQKMLDDYLEKKLERKQLS